MPKYLIEGRGFRITIKAKDSDTALNRFNRKYPGFRERGKYITEIEEWL